MSQQRYVDRTHMEKMMTDTGFESSPILRRNQYETLKPLTSFQGTDMEKSFVSWPMLRQLHGESCMCSWVRKT